MHYFIDGYNLLFRVMQRNSEDLQTLREHIIKDLQSKISLLKLDVTVVFDSSQIGFGSRSHYNDLEILFTSEGQSADECILDEIKISRNPQQETIITSDKELSRKARNLGAYSDTVEEFIHWVNRAYKKKLQAIRKSFEPLPKPKLPQPSITSRSQVPSKDASQEVYIDYYHQIFESEWQQLQKEEALLKMQKAQREPVSDRQKRKKMKSLSSQNPPNQITNSNDPATETERWMKIFETRCEKDNESEPGEE